MAPLEALGLSTKGEKGPNPLSSTAMAAVIAWIITKATNPVIQLELLSRN
jgi:hypothetical protein